MSPLRIIPAHLAHTLSEAQPCPASLLFDSLDTVPAVCGLALGDHVNGWHANAEDTRRWRRIDRYETEAMIRPGSEPLR